MKLFLKSISSSFPFCFIKWVKSLGLDFVRVLFSCFDLLFLLVLEFTLSSRVLCHFRYSLILPSSGLLVFHRPVVVSLKFLFCMLGPSPELFHNINVFWLQTLYRDGGQLAILFLKPFTSSTKSFAPSGVISMFLLVHHDSDDTF